MIAGCADTVDIGELSYSMVLTDDLDNNGRMDLLVSTMNGNIYSLETAAVYHPMKAWTSVVCITPFMHTLLTTLTLLVLHGYCDAPLKSKASTHKCRSQRPSSARPVLVSVHLSATDSGCACIQQ